ncbi:MAG: glycosyltransferase family 4 protein [Betaproteobacteria bacterium]|nr:MAG: glycosyltransferase family 4 protein [Betaproteobacteria bacterium]
MKTDAPVLVIGSASVHVARFVRGLCAAGQSVVASTHGELAVDPHPALLATTTIDLGVRNWRAPKQIRELMRKWTPRIVHAHQANSVGWHAGRAVRGSGVPLVLTLWGSDVLLTPAISPLHRWMIKQALRSATAWTADSRIVLEAADALLGSRTAAARRVWIPLGIDDSGVASQPEKRILSCRLHKPLYRIDAVIRAFARLTKTHADWTLEVAASGTESEALKRLAAELDVIERIEFSGMLSPHALALSYRRAAVYMSVPVSDGTSVSLLEAMAAGCVPVLSDLPANREWVVDGLNGFLVSDLDRLDQAMQQAIGLWESGQWAATGGAWNPQLIRRKATFTRNIEQFLALYAQLRAG